MKKIIIFSVLAVVGVVAITAVSLFLIKQAQTSRRAPPPVAADQLSVEDEKKLALLVFQLGDASIDKRTEAAYEIRKMGKVSLPFLQRMAPSVSEDVRAQLQVLIAEFGGPPVVTIDERVAKLVIQLADPDPSRHLAASEEIRRIGKPALPHLERSVKAVNPELAAAINNLIQALGGAPVSIAGQPVVPPKVEEVESEEPLIKPKVERLGPEPPKYQLAVTEKQIGGAVPSKQDIDLVISPNGQRVAFYVERPSGFYVTIVDGRMGSEFHSVGMPIFSPDSKRFAYPAVVGTQHFLQIDNEQTRFYSWVGKPAFSPDSKRIAFVGEQDGKQFVVIGNEEGKKYDAIRSELLFSPNGRRIAYVVRSGGGMAVVVNDQEGPVFDRIEGLVFSPNSKRIAYAVTQDGRRRMVVDHEGGREYDQVEQPVFSPDSKHLVYRAANGNKRLLVMDGEAIKEYQDIRYSTFFSPDGKRQAYAAARDNKQFIVVDGEEKEIKFNGIAHNMPVFSPDGQRLAYAAVRGDKFYMVVDGAESPPYDGIGSPPIFSHDSRHVAYLAKRGDKWLIVVDGMETKEFPGFPKGSVPVFETSRQIFFIFLRATDIYLMQIDLVPEWD